MRKSLVVGTAAVLPLLAGCFDLNQSLEVGADGQAVMRMEMAMDSSVLALAGANQEDPFTFCDEEEMTDVPEGVTVEVERSTSDTDEVCVVTATGPIETIAVAMANGGFAPQTEETAGASEVTMTDEGDGVYAFDMRLDAGEAMGEAGGEGAEMEAAMMQMMLQFTAGRTLQWSITAPEIIETTGALSDDGKTASYSVALSDLLTMPEGDYSFFVRFDTTP